MIEKLLKFESSADFALFSEIFGCHAVHLWNKFRYKNNHNVLQFVRTLDSENYKLFTQYMEALNP